MQDLMTWLRAQLDEDERVARAAASATRTEGEHPVWIQGEINYVDFDEPVIEAHPDQAGVINEAQDPVVYDEGRDPALDTHIARHDPARVLRRVKADRRILALHEPKLVRSPKTVTELGPVDPGPPVTQTLLRRREMRDYWVCPTCCDGRCYEAPGDEHESRVPYCCETVPLMALPFSDCDGYLPEWAPQDVPATPE